jgi:hypothetical protein
VQLYVSFRGNDNASVAHGGSFINLKPTKLGKPLVTILGKLVPSLAVPIPLSSDLILRRCSEIGLSTKLLD